MANQSVDYDKGIKPRDFKLHEEIAMRKIIVGTFITLDGVIQAAGGPEEGFEYGGWSAPYYDEALDQIAEKQKQPAKDLLLGRKTFEIFASFFPDHEEIWPGVNDVTKYVMSNSLDKSDPIILRWINSVVLHSVEEIQNLKNSKGGDIQVHGSGDLVQTLLRHDLVDELWLLIHPLTLGVGKRFFGEGTIPAAFKLVACTATPSGVIAAHYIREGEVQTGMMGG
jgi:dihydrofolate reductase